MLNKESISKFITFLNKAELHPSSEELADVFWLALQIDVPIIKTEPDFDNKNSISNQENNNKQQPENTALPEKPPETPPVKLPTTEKQQQKSQLFPHQQNGSGINTGIKGQAFRTPALSLLHNALAFNRAFRPLRKTVASRFHTELAIEETVQYIAETHIFSPVLKGKPERWLELVIIIDDTVSMRIWQPLLKEFRRLLELQGTFTKIHFYQLDTENEQAWVLKNKRVIKNFEIINTHQPRLILVLSDCVAKAWHSNNGVFNLLQQWSQKHPVSIMQMLPYRLWKGTALGYAEEARFTAPLPLALNKNLNIDTQDFWFIDDISELQKGFKILVLTLEPEIVKTWAKLVLGKKDNWLKGVVFENKTVLIPPLEQEPEKMVNEITAEQRIKQFKSFASPMAQQLAAYLATVPLDLSVMNVVQKLMLPQSQQVHLAEVFLGGLLKRVPNHQWLEYDFHAGVRELLLDTVIVADAVFVLTRVSDFVDQRFGQSLDFLALLANPNLTDGIELNESTRPFAEVGAKILRRLGGEYEKLVDVLEGKKIKSDENIQDLENYQKTDSSYATSGLNSTFIAKILSPKVNGKNAIGTAYPISKDLIITARHVVDFEERDISKPISIIWNGTDYSNDESYVVQVPQSNIVFNTGEKYDVVLIRCNVPIKAYASLPVLADQYPKGGERWESMGFPLIGKQDDGSRHKVSAMGEFFPLDEYSAILDLYSKGDAKEKTGWQGISGAPVFVGDTLVAIITHTPNDINERLRAVSIAYLLQHEKAFKNLIGRSYQKKYRPDPSFLPYLLDRGIQENELIDAIAQYNSFNKPLLCIVSGSYDDCCSEKFVQRIARCVLPQVPSTKEQLKDDNYYISFVQTGDFKNKEQLHRNIQRSLGGSFAQNRTAKIEEIKKGFQEQRRPVLLYAALSTEDCRNCDGAKTLQHFLSFWQDWQIEQQPHYLILVCLFFYYEDKPSSFLSRLIGKKDLNSQIEQSLPTLINDNCVVLPRLAPIKLKHIIEWSNSHDVRNFFKRSIYDEDENFRAEVQRIYQEQKTEELPLGYLARKLIPFLQKLDK